MSTSVGSIHYDLGLDTSKFNAATGRVKQQTSTMAQGFDTLSTIGKGAMLAVGAAITYSLVKNLDNAITRIDTLNNAPKVLKNLGFSAEESGAATKALEQGIKGLPTSLDAATSSLVRIASASGLGIKESTQLTLAFNNMALAGGKGPEEAQRALVQFTQALGRGKFEGEEFNTMMEVMPAQMQQVATALIGPGAKAQELKEKLSDGSITMAQFNDAVMKLNTEGGANFASFTTQAKDATGGLKTAMANANTAITRGIASIINAIGATNISAAINKFGELFEKALKKVADGITAFADYLKNNEWAVWAFAGAIGGLAIAIGVALAGAIWGVVTAIAAAVVTAAPFILAGAAIAGIAFLIKQNWDKVKPAVDLVVGAFMAFWGFIKPFRDFIADQFIKAWNDLKAAFDRARQAVEPFMPQLRILGLILLTIVVIPILAVVAVLGILVAGFVLVITFIARVVGWLAQLGGWFLQLAGQVSQAMNSFMGSIANGINNAVNWFASLPGRARGAIGNLGGMLYNAGVEIIQGFINGINNMFGRVRGTLTDLTNKIKSWKGPEQKDKTLLTSAGEMVIGGFITGLESQYDSVRNSLSGFTQSLNAEVGLGSSLSYSPSGSGALLSGDKSGGIGLMNQTINIGTIQDRSDAQYIVDSINRSYELAEMGMTP